MMKRSISKKSVNRAHEVVEFMTEFARRFNVDLRSFDPDRHFPPERTAFDRVRRWLGPDVGRAAVRISIRDLVHAAEKGIWPSRPPR